MVKPLRPAVISKGGNSTNNIKAWGAQRILAMIPPSDSEPSDVENDENNEEGVFSRIVLDDSSSCRTLSPGLEEF
ncbi:unnamed protein product [Parnassius apollo]|uniref:(apollo) hypothetical protein n=1 Tax=Parnassius apollo TaxID=110799 RepID=A0A8S3XSH2_PARAO|nr:unnamed protein product [Parnassius apollo]